MCSKKTFSTFEESLDKYVPPPALSAVCEVLRETHIFLKIVQPRKTLHGSYCLPTPYRKHFITINNNLNPYAFLITLLHEIAHAHAWTQYKAKGHQKEWKTCFKQLLNQFIQLNAFPDEVQTALEQHIEKIKYSDIADINLTKTLRKYDVIAPVSDSKTVVLQEIPKNTLFLHNKKIFRKGDILRKYILCKNMNNNKMYRCHPLMMVHIMEEINL